MRSQQDVPGIVHPPFPPAYCGWPTQEGAEGEEEVRGCNRRPGTLAGAAVFENQNENGREGRTTREWQTDETDEKEGPVPVQGTREGTRYR